MSSGKRKLLGGRGESSKGKRKLSFNDESGSESETSMRQALQNLLKQHNHKAKMKQIASVTTPAVPANVIGDRKN